MGFWKSGVLFDSLALGAIAANVLSSFGYDVGKTVLGKLIEGPLPDSDLPGDQHLGLARRSALHDAAAFVGHSMAAELGPRSPWFTAFMEQWKAGTIFERPLFELRDTPHHDWLAGYFHAIADRGIFDKLVDQVDITDDDVARLLGNEADSLLSELLNDRFCTWVKNHVSPSEPPAVFQHGSQAGWLIAPDRPSRITFFQAYCVFLTERLKSDEQSFRAFALKAIAEVVKHDGGTFETEEIVRLVKRGVEEALTQRFIDIRNYLGHQFVAVSSQLAKIQLRLNEQVQIVQGIQATLGQLYPLVRHQVPPPCADFSGRRDERYEIGSRLQRGRGAVIVGLRGLGGVGKTELALKIAEEIGSSFPDGQLFIDLQGASQCPLSAEEAMTGLLQPQAVTEKLPEGPALANLFRTLFSGKRLILILDNARDAEQVRQLLLPEPAVVVVTSRWRFHVPGLEVFEIDKLPRTVSKEMLLTICPRIGDSADELAEACGDLPLALRLVGSALNQRPMLSVGSFLARLKSSRLAELDAAAADAGESSVTTTLKISYELLADRPEKDLQACLRTLAVFPSDFDAQAACAVFGTTERHAEDCLAALCSAGLISYVDQLQRFSLHDLTREFLQEISTDHEVRAAACRHAKYYSRLLAYFGQLYLNKNDDLLVVLFGFDLERRNIEAGQKWAATNAENDHEMARVAAFYPALAMQILLLRLTPAERISWCKAALPAARGLGIRPIEGIRVVSTWQRTPGNR